MVHKFLYLEMDLDGTHWTDTDDVTVVVVAVDMPPPPLLGHDFLTQSTFGTTIFVCTMEP